MTPFHSDVYEITGQGERYLEGLYDVDWFPLPDPARRILVGRAQGLDVVFCRLDATW